MTIYQAWAASLLTLYRSQWSLRKATEYAWLSSSNNLKNCSPHSCSITFHLSKWERIGIFPGRKVKIAIKKKKKKRYPHAEPSHYSTLVGKARRNKNEKNHPQNANTFKVSILKILLKNCRSQVKSKHISFKTLKIGTVLLCFLECIRWKVAFDQCQLSCLTVLWYVSF